MKLKIRFTVENENWSEEEYQENNINDHEIILSERDIRYLIERNYDLGDNEVEDIWGFDTIYEKIEN